MSDAMSLSGEFRWWREEARDEKMRLLMGVIADHVSAGVMSAVRTDQYEALFKKKWMPRAVRGPYYFLVSGLIQQVANKQHQLGLEGPIDFIFDDQVMERAQIIKDWEALKRLSKAPKTLLGQTPEFRNDDTDLPLQAADMIAGFHRINLQNRLMGRPSLSLPPSIRGKREVPMLTLLWDEENLRSMRSFVDRQNHLT